MHSDDYPVQGCSCCDLFEPLEDKKHNFNIFKTCVDDDITTATSDYKKCFNKVNLYYHNSLRKTHGAAALTEDTTLAVDATKRARVL